MPIFNFPDYGAGNDGVQRLEDASFPAQILSGFVEHSGYPKSGVIFSWREVICDMTQGWLSGLDSPRDGVNSARELNNNYPTITSGSLTSGAIDSSGYYNASGFPFYARLHLAGVVSGNLFYNYTQGGVAAAAPSAGGGTALINGQTALSPTFTLALNTSGQQVLNAFCYVSGPGTFDVTAQVGALLTISGQAPNSGATTYVPQTIYAWLSSQASGSTGGADLTGCTVIPLGLSGSTVYGTGNMQCQVTTNFNTTVYLWAALNNATYVSQAQILQAQNPSASNPNGGTRLFVSQIHT